jgi:hypothetical protein
MFTYYEIKSKPYTFYANVSSSNNDIFVHVGGKQRCIIMIIYGDTNEAVLQLLQHHESCTAGSQLLKKGTGTVRMVECVIRFIRDVFPKVKKIVFSDNSSIICPKGKKVDLQTLYLALHGMTWYEKKFHAIPEKEYRKVYDHGKKILQDKLTEKPDFDKLMENTPTFITSSLKAVYDTCDSITDLLHTLVEQEADCIIFYNWLFQYVIQCIPLLTRFTWKIDVTTFETKTIQIRELKSKPDIMFHQGGGFIIA